MYSLKRKIPGIILMILIKLYIAWNITQIYACCCLRAETRLRTVSISVIFSALNHEILIKEHYKKLYINIVELAGKFLDREWDYIVPYKSWAWLYSSLYIQPAFRLKDISWFFLKLKVLIFSFTQLNEILPKLVLSVPILSDVFYSTTKFF